MSVRNECSVAQGIFEKAMATVVAEAADGLDDATFGKRAARCARLALLAARAGTAVIGIRAAEIRANDERNGARQGATP